MPSVLQRFSKWAEKMSKNDTLLAHFYIDKESRIFDPPSYFLFNMASADRCWQIIGTPGAGVKYRGRTSKVPVVNCWKVDKEFCKALRKYYQKQSEYSKYKYAVIFSKTKLQNQLEVVEVRPFWEVAEINSKNSWKFDNPKAGKGVLNPFNFCKVVRARIPKDPILKEPIYRISPKAILGIMVQYGDMAKMREALYKKGMSHVRIFSL